MKWYVMVLIPKSEGYLQVFSNLGGRGDITHNKSVFRDKKFQGYMLTKINEYDYGSDLSHEKLTHLDLNKDDVPNSNKIWNS